MSVLYVKNKADVVFLIDGSGSIASGDWTSLGNFMTNLVHSFTIGNNNIKIGIVQFANSQTKTEIALSSSKDNILSAVNTMKNNQIRGNTPTLLGINAAKTLIDGSGTRSGVPKVIAILTDGLANNPCNCNSCNCDYQPTCGTDFNKGVSCGRVDCVGTLHTDFRFCITSSSVDRWKNSAQSNCQGYWGLYGGVYPGCYGDISLNQCEVTMGRGNYPTCEGTSLDFCYSCSNPHVRAQEINALSDYKVIAMGIGQDLVALNNRGLNYIKLMNYQADKTIAVDWNDLDTVKNELLSQVCNTN